MIHTVNYLKDYAMKCYKKLLMSVACSALVFGATVVRAADDAKQDEFVSKIASGDNVVLFKIHDVNPIKDEKGVVTDCEFGITLYNRSPKSIDTATMNLSWLDEGVANVIDIEDNQDDTVVMSAKQMESLQQSVKPAKTEDFVSTTLTTSVALPQIKPFRQVSLKSKIKSDRCFLMIGDASYSFSACSVTSPTSEGTKKVRAKKSGGSDCDTLFKFVSPRDPEYYREFQKVSFNKEAEQKAEERRKDMEEMEKNYKRMLDDVKGISDVLSSF